VLLSAVATPRVTRAVHLVRHGESSWNRLGLIQGQSPLAGGLTARGWVQASAVAAGLERSLAPALARRDAVVVASDLVRARQTAAVIACRLGAPLRLHEGLREQRLGRLEGHASDAVLDGAVVRDVVASLWSDWCRRPPGLGETVSELSERAARAVAELAAGAAVGELVLVAHGGLIHSLLARTAARDGRGTVALPPVPNAALTTFLVHPDGSLGAPADGPTACARRAGHEAADFPQDA
jgi:probable phosphoglycerate mutase